MLKTITTLIAIIIVACLGLTNLDTANLNATDVAVVTVKASCPQDDVCKVGTTVPFFAVLLGKTASRRMVECMYWFVRASERIFNYTGEMIKGTRFKIVNFVKSLVKVVAAALTMVKQNKLGILLIGGLILLAVSAPIDVNDTAVSVSVAVGGATCKPPSKKGNESMDNRLEAMDHFDKLISLLFNKPLVKQSEMEYDPDTFVEYSSKCDEDKVGKTLSVPVNTLKFSKSGKTIVVPLKVATGATDNGKAVVEDLLIPKRCVASAGEFPFETLEYFSIPVPRDDNRKSLLMMRLDQWLMATDRTVFGSIKQDSKGRTKFYTLKISEASRYADNCGELMPYFHKLLTDCKAVGFYNVKLVNPAVKDAEGNVLVPNDLADYAVCDHNDGAGLGRPSLAPKDGLVRQVQAIPVSCISGTEKVPVAKGLLDFGMFENDADWDAAFGVDVDFIIFRGDMIKTFSDLADDGLWVVGWTWMTGKSIDYPFHWEVSQFHSNPEELHKVLTPISDKAVDGLFSLISTKRGMLSYISEKIIKLTERGVDAPIQMKVIGMLMSNATERFTWTKSQISKMVLSDVFNIAKASGVFGEGIPCLTNDLLSGTDPRYLSKFVTRALGADNDGDYIVRLVNKKLGKMMFWRFPVVSGPVIVDIPEGLINQLEDRHPEVVASFDEYGFDLEFSRDDIEKHRNIDPLNECFETMESIINGEALGENTNLLARLLHGLRQTKATAKKLLGWSSNRFLADAKSAAFLIELAAIALKYKVSGVDSVYGPRGLKALFPLAFAKYKKAPKDWKGVVKVIDDLSKEVTTFLTVEGYTYRGKVATKGKLFVAAGDAHIGKHHIKKGATLLKMVVPMEWDSKRYVHALKNAVDAYEAWRSDVVSCKAMRRYIQLGDVAITQNKVDRAAGALSRFGMSLTEAYDTYAHDSDELKTAVSAIIKACESYGARLSLDELKMAIWMYYAKTSGTGASGVHMAGNRLFQVFGKDLDYASAEMDLTVPNVHSILCFRKSIDIPFEGIALDKVVITPGKVELTNLGITLPISKDDMLVPAGKKLQAIHVAPYSSKSLRSAVFTCKDIS